jgi:hypothetical protein
MNYVTSKFFFAERVRIARARKIFSERREKDGDAYASRQDADDPRSISARADLQLLGRGQLAFDAAARFGTVAFAAIWITLPIIGATIAATASASRSMIAAPRILMSGLDDPLVRRPAQDNPLARPVPARRTQGNQAIDVRAAREDAQICRTAATVLRPVLRGRL